MLTQSCCLLPAVTTRTYPLLILLHSKNYCNHNRRAFVCFAAVADTICLHLSVLPSHPHRELFNLGTALRLVFAHRPLGSNVQSRFIFSKARPKQAKNSVYQKQKLQASDRREPLIGSSALSSSRWLLPRQASARVTVVVVLVAIPLSSRLPSRAGAPL